MTDRHEADDARHSAQPNMFVAVLAHPLETIASLILIALVGIIFAQVIARYFLEISLSWSEELARFLLMWLAALGAAYGFKERSHFALSFAVMRLPRAIRREASVVVYVIVALFLGVFTWSAARFAIGGVDHYSPAMGMPMAIPYASAAVGGALMLFYATQAAFDEYRDMTTSDPSDSDAL